MGKFLKETKKKKFKPLYESRTSDRNVKYKWDVSSQFHISIFILLKEAHSQSKRAWQEIKMPIKSSLWKCFWHKYAMTMMSINKYSSCRILMHMAFSATAFYYSLLYTLPFIFMWMKMKITFNTAFRNIIFAISRNVYLKCLYCRRLAVLFPLKMCMWYEYIYHDTWFMHLNFVHVVCLPQITKIPIRLLSLSRSTLNCLANILCFFFFGIYVSGFYWSHLRICEYLSYNFFVCFEEENEWKILLDLKIYWSWWLIFETLPTKWVSQKHGITV